MNRLITLAVFLFCFTTAGCGHLPPGPPSPLEQNSIMYRGNHLLRQIAQKQISSSHLEGTYFVFAAGMSGETTEEANVTFAWLGNDGVYRFQTLPLSKVRIQIHPNIGTPFVKFRWNNWGIKYVVIGCNPKDWPESIQLPHA